MTETEAQDLEFSLPPVLAAFFEEIEALETDEEGGPEGLPSPLLGHAMARLGEVPELADLFVAEEGGPMPWTYEKITAMATEAIEAKLGSLGITVDRLTFTEAAEQMPWAWGVWQGGLDPLSEERSSDDALFRDLAAVILWRRYDIDQPCGEELFDTIDAGYVLLDDGKTEDACRLWLMLWKRLERHLDDGVSTLEEIDDLYGLLGELGAWAAEALPEALATAVDEGLPFGDALVAWIDRFQVRFCEEDPELIVELRALRDEIAEIPRAEA